LVSIPWSINGIHSIRGVPKGTTYNTAFFTDAVMPSLTENVRSRTRRKTSKGWLILMNNTCPHNSERAQSYVEASRAERLPDPAYSPDLTVSDFFLFESIKGKLSDYSCESREDPLNATTEIVTRVDQEMMLSVCKS
jgi:hypothetical protein